MENRKPQQAIFKMVLIALLSAMAIGLFYLEFPIFTAAPFLKLDFSDLPALFAGIFIGPVAGVTVELIKNLVELLTKGLGTQMGFGNLMNFAVGCAYVLPTSLLCRAWLKRGDGGDHRLRAIFACLVGMAAIIVVGLGMNYWTMPLFFRFFLHQELTRDTIVPLLGYATGMNAIKGAMLSAGALLLLAWQKRAPGVFRVFDR